MRLESWLLPIRVLKAPIELPDILNKDNESAITNMAKGKKYLLSILRLFGIVLILITAIIVAMFYILTILTAFMIVAGQALWKTGVDGAKLSPSLNGLISQKTVLLFGSPLILGGAVVYGVATLLYIYSLSKYQYSTTQSVVVSLSLIFTLFIAKYFFNEKINLVNLLGVAIIIFGIILVTRR